jgi:uncharacterized HAD superfamily protein
MPKRKLRIGIDIDDVLIKSAEFSIRLYNEEYGTKLTLDDWYDFSSPEVWGVDDLPTIVKRVMDIFKDEAFVSVEPVEDAKAVLGHLVNDGHELCAITGRTETIRQQTILVLDTHFPDIFKSETVYFVDHFSHDGQKTSKADVGTRLGLTHFIDDQVEHANALNQAGVTTILFSQGYKWNQTGADKSVKRASDWKSIGEFLDAEAA